MAEPSFETVITAIAQLLSGALDEDQMPAAEAALRQLFDDPAPGIGLFDPCRWDRNSRAPAGDDVRSGVSDDVAATVVAMGEALRGMPPGAAGRCSGLPGQESTQPMRGRLHAAGPQSAYAGMASPVPEQAAPFAFGDAGQWPGRQSFDAAEASLLRKLAPVFRRAVEIRHQLGRIAIQRDEARDALDALELGIAVVDQDLRIIHANIGADEILAAPDGAITLRQGRLCACHSADQRLLKRRIDMALQIGDPPVPLPTSLILRGSEHTHSVSACIMPAARSSSGPYRRAMVALRRLDRSTDMAACARQLFDLTDTEAKFASALAGGQSLAEAAEAQCVRISTARTHLARIFQKTGTRQQSQLVSLLRSAALPLRQRS